MMMKITTIVLTLLCFSLKAQITTDCSSSYNSAEELVELIVGDGVAYSNASFSAFDCAAGYFSGASNLGLESGLVLATGGVESVPVGGTWNANGTSGDIDADLQGLLTSMSAPINNINNLIVLEFDFVPSSDTVYFEYVFASKEYSGYTCSQFNDVFGFFISGPGINGSFSNNAKNIALVPDPDNLGSFTNTPVAINTINSGFPSSGNSTPCDNVDSNWQDYSGFFVDNSAEEEVSFNGFTTPLTAMSEVEANQTYHVKLAIADVSDGALNSAVFIREGSLNSLLSGCMDPLACNYNEDAISDNGTCTYIQEYYDCQGNCISDIDLDGVCDELEIYGCTDVMASNYSPQATEDNGSCDYSSAPCLLPEHYVGNTGSNMTVFFQSSTFDNFPELDENAYLVAITSNSGQVVGSVELNAMNQFTLIVWGDDVLSQEIEGAANGESIEYQLVNGYVLYNLILVSESNSTTYLSNGIGVVSEISYNLNCLQGSSDEFEGCTDEEAFNYNEEAVIDDATCVYELNITFNQPANESDYNALYYVNIDSLVDGGLQVDDGDLIGAFYMLDGNLVAAGYASYEGISPVEITLVGDDPDTPEVEGIAEGQEIVWIIQDVETGVNTLIDKAINPDLFEGNSNTSVHLSQVSQDFVLGCVELDACNYSILANINDATCVYAMDGLDCNGDCINDADMDGECDEWDYDDGLGIDEEQSEKIQLIKMVDILGKEQSIHKEGVLLFYIYDNGAVIKKIK